METNMTLSFDPQDTYTYIDMVMNLSDETLTQFFDSMGIEINLSEEDEGILYDCEA
jgi:hypothetical protein